MVLPHEVYAHIGKRILDLALVLLTAPLSLLIVLISAIALWIEGGTPFYTQERLGQNGDRFRMLKLRTMVRDADALLAEYLANDPVMRAEWNTAQKLRNDPRVTRVGAFLRATSLDELPQLWNVFRGEMSLVGPRPMMPEQLSLYGDARYYTMLKPGITGLWQVSTRNEKGFSYRTEVDATYCMSLSLGQDLKLILRTFGVVVRRTGV
ncbi:sugar transferase [Pseudodonghicola sp. IC7]|uniref:Sugar transferase n=1 Tax=Pseudodonghicola flavimaris TaxID=3050036 RepID=A0ABT7F3K0_9RHOB|nr:sugar transferase [Pseudodonghicola flavimaris]MDK3019181.1 sugar transferase [Pseudodonghicola flavimaris]